MQFSNYQTVIFLVIIASQMSLFFAGGLALLLQHKGQNDRSRLFIGSFFMALSITCLLFIGSALINPINTMHFFNMILDPYFTIFSLAIWMFIPFYLLEIKRPYWLNATHACYILLLWLICSFTYIIWHASTGFCELTYLTNIHDIIPNIHKTDVWMRVILVLLFVPYSVMEIFIHGNWRKNNAPQFWVRLLIICSFLFAFTYITGISFRIPAMMLAHFLLIDLIGVCVLTLEFKVRIPVPERIVHDASLSVSETEKPPVYPSVAQNDLSQRLELALKDEIWRNPDLQMDDICKYLLSNRTYVSVAIKELGYMNFAQMINRKRVEYIHEHIEQDPNSKLLNLFFEAGYRSRNTAARCFFIQYGYSASDFKNSLLK